MVIYPSLSCGTAGPDTFLRIQAQLIYPGRGSLVRKGGGLESHWCPAPQEFKSLPRRPKGFCSTPLASTRVVSVRERDAHFCRYSCAIGENKSILPFSSLPRTCRFIECCTGAMHCIPAELIGKNILLQEWQGCVSGGCGICIP